MEITNNLNTLLENVRYEVQYVDYEEGQFTVPIILTKNRAKQIMNDNSIKKVRFTSILGNQTTFTFEHKYLFYEVN